MALLRKSRAGAPTAVAFMLASLAVSSCPAHAQGVGSSLPATAPTGFSAAGMVAPLAAAATPQDRAGSPRHRAEVSCAGGQLTVHADNSSLNGILRSISRCTGMRISGGVMDQRVFGNYGPAAPATVLATLLDGTGTNMLLQETASAQPAELILTPRTGGGPTPPSPSTAPDDEGEDTNPASRSQPMGNTPGNMPPNASGQPFSAGPRGQSPRNAGSAQPPNANQTPVPQPTPGSAVTGPVPIPQPTNNVNGSPNNVSPTAASYPTTNSVPLDSLPTPSTTPSSNGIVDAPNPPAPGSDTANLLRGATANQPGAATITPAPTSGATLPGGTNTTTPVPTGAIQPGADATGNPATGNPPTGALTPQQVYQQLQQIRGQQQQQQAPTTPPTQSTTPQ